MHWKTPAAALIAAAALTCPASAAEPNFARDLLFDSKGVLRSWAQIVTDATRRSMRANGGGKPFTVHNCYPEEGACADSILYPANPGKDTSSIMVMVRTKPSGRITDRAVCKFNEEFDLRICFYYDNKHVVITMKGTDGKWQQVDDDDETTEPKDES